MRYIVHLLSWLSLIIGGVMIMEHLPPSDWGGDSATLIVEAVNRVAFIVAGVGFSLLGALGVYGTRTNLREVEEWLVRISRGEPEPQESVTKTGEDPA